MSYTDTGKQGILWKYSTPLEGELLAKIVGGLGRKGVTIAPTLTYLPGNLVSVSPLELYVAPSGNTNSLIKVYTEEIFSIAFTYPERYLAFEYDWVNDDLWRGDFVALTVEEVANPVATANRVIIAEVDWFDNMGVWELSGTPVQIGLEDSILLDEFNQRFKSFEVTHGVVSGGNIRFYFNFSTAAGARFPAKISVFDGAEFGADSNQNIKRVSPTQNYKTIVLPSFPVGAPDEVWVALYFDENGVPNYYWDSYNDYADKPRLRDTTKLWVAYAKITRSLYPHAVKLSSIENFKYPSVILKSISNVGWTSSFATGQAGTDSASITLQALGYYIRSTGLVSGKITNPVSNNILWDNKEGTVSINPTGNWATIAELPAVGTAQVISAVFDIVSSTISYSASFRIDFFWNTSGGLYYQIVPLAANVSNITYLWKIRVIYSNDITNRGSKIQIKLYSSATTTIPVSVNMKANTRSGINVGSRIDLKTPYDDNTSILLPDGSAFTTYGASTAEVDLISRGVSADFILGLGGDTSGNSVLKRSGKGVYDKYGINTSFAGGNDGSIPFPVTELGVIGKYFRDNQIVFTGRNRAVSSTVSIPYEKSWSRSISTSTSTQWWTIAKIDQNNLNVGIAWFRVKIGLNGLNWYQDICVTMAGVDGPNIQILNATMRASSVTYLPYYRVLYSNSNNNSGCLLQIGVIDSGSFSRGLTVELGDNSAISISALGWSDVVINASADGTPNLPDGTVSGAADYTISTAVQGTMIGRPGAFSASAVGGASTGSLMSEAGKALFDNYKATLFAAGVIGGTGTTEGEKAGKAVFDNYKAALFALGVVGGTGTSEGEKAGKAVFDNYKAALFALGVAGGTGTSEGEKSGKAVYDKYGVDTDFPTGNQGTAGTNEIQGIGYEIYNNGLRINKLMSKLGFSFIKNTYANANVTVASGAIRWFTIAKTTADAITRGFVRFGIRTICHSETFQEIEVSCRTNSVPDIKVLYCNTYLSLVDYQYLPQFRILYSSTDNSAGIVLQIGLSIASTTTTASIDVTQYGFPHPQNALALVDTISTTVDGDANLPDGTVSGAGGYTIGDTVYGFGLGETEIWSGSQAIAASGNYNISSFFTGFSNQMFKSYRIKYNGGQFNRDAHIDINKPQILSNTSMAKNDGGITTYLILTMFPDGSANVLNIGNGDSSYGIVLFSVVGFI